MNDSKSPMLSNRLYDILKYMAQILLPAVGALYFGLAQVWGLPKGGEVVGTITVIDAFLGVLLGLSTAQYNSSEAKYDGHINVTETDSSKNFELNLHKDPEDLDKQNEVLFKVNKPST